jgi:hypothetical protein
MNTVVGFTSAIGFKNFISWLSHSSYIAFSLQQQQYTVKKGYYKEKSYSSIQCSATKAKRRKIILITGATGNIKH